MRVVSMEKTKHQSSREREICKNGTANIGICSFAIGPIIHRLRWSHSVIHWSMFIVLILQFFPARATSFFILFRSAIRVCNKHIAAFSFYQGTMYVYLFRGPSYREWQRWPDAACCMSTRCTRLDALEARLDVFLCSMHWRLAGAMHSIDKIK